MWRKSIYPAAALLLALSFFVFPKGSSAASLDAKTIKAGLKTTKVEEGDFVEKVVKMAKKGEIPPSLVESTFQWARKKPAWRFQYFKRGLTVRAAEMGISL